MEKKIDAMLFDSFYKIAASLTSTLNEEEVLKMIMNLMQEIFQPENWSLFSYDELTDKLIFRLVVGNEAENLIGRSFNAGKGIAGLSLKSRKPVVIPDATNDERILKVVPEGSDFVTRSVIAVPMYSKDRPLGVIEMINTDIENFSEEKIKLLEIIADFASIAVQNANFLKTIEEKATIDDCTDLYNARYMYKILENEISRSKRSGGSFSVVFFDLDRFKNVNDNYGHLIDSQLLREVANVVKACIRPTDYGVRYGGDEFVVILQGADFRNALAVTERIRETLNSKTFFMKEGYNIKVPASFGLATFPEDAGNIEEIIKAADNAMYKSKETGRNKISHCH
ncbi:MAG TPA: sensor domain-containing diguanylate cyclase [bacterium]|nr:sensor domain-containing diguanylate cyclase [bacterium]